MVDVKRYKYQKLKQQLKITSQYEKRILQSKKKLDKTHEKLMIAISKVGGKLQFLKAKKNKESEVNKKIQAIAKELSLLETETRKAEKQIKIPLSKEKRFMGGVRRKLKSQMNYSPSISSADIRRLNQIEKKKEWIMKQVKILLAKEMQARRADFNVFRKFREKFRKRSEKMRAEFQILSKEKTALNAERSTLKYEQSKLRAELNSLRKEQVSINKTLSSVAPKKKKKKRRKRQCSAY